MTDLKRLAGYAKFISVTILIQICVEGLNSLVQVGSFMMGPAPADPKDWSMGMIILGAAQMILAIPGIVLFLINAFAVCQWMYRCYLNLEAVQTPGLKHKAIFAAGYWFVPLVNLIKPYYVMKEIFIASSASDTETERKDLRKAKAPGYLTLWWTCWVGQGLLGQVVFHAMNRPDAMQNNYLDLVSAFSNCLSVVAGVFLIKIVKEITARQEDKIPELKRL